MSYSQKTPVLNIPVLGYRNKILPETELTKYKIIENMLIAGTQGIKNCIFDEGYFRLTESSDGIYTVTLGAMGSSPSLEGMAQGAYFRAADKIKWEDLKEGNRYWLYIAADPKTFEDCSRVFTVSSRYEVKNKLLVAYLDLRDTDRYEIEVNPDGKVYTADLANHITDNQNPHGKRLYQDELVVTQRLLLQNTDGENPAVAIQDKNGSIRTVDVFSPRIEVINFESGGRGGIVIKASRPVLHAEIQRTRLDDLDASLGDIAVGYNDSDENVDEDIEFCVYNSGVEGISLRAAVYYR